MSRQFILFFKNIFNNILDLIQIKLTVIIINLLVSIRFGFIVELNWEWNVEFDSTFNKFQFMLLQNCTHSYFARLNSVLCYFAIISLVIAAANIANFVPKEAGSLSSVHQQNMPIKCY